MSSALDFVFIAFIVHTNYDSMLLSYSTSDELILHSKWLNFKASTSYKAKYCCYRGQSRTTSAI